MGDIMQWPASAKFAFGDRVRKHSGSWWEGRIVGFYSTRQTPIGYDIQMDMVPNGPTQIYPEAALELAPEVDVDAVEEGAKIIASWIGYAWDGLGERDISDQYPDWSYNGIGSRGMQGGRPALRKIAAKILALQKTPPVDHVEPVGYLKPNSPEVVQPLYIDADERTEEWQKQVFTIPVYAAPPSCAPSPQSNLRGLTAEQLCRSPLIEWLVPTTEEWDACEVMQDRYDLMKKRIRLAFTDAALAASEGSIDE